LPTFIGHAVTGFALSSIASRNRQWLRIGVLSLCCAVVPDIDSIGFRLGIPYQHWLGHRGFSHGIFFAAIMAVIASQLIAGKSIKARCLSFCVFFASGLLHSILDAMTNGGLGVAFFSPFSNERYFFPWRPIEVSPISLKRFLTPRGFNVMKNEFVWILMPSLCFMALAAWYRLKKQAVDQAERSET